MRSKCFGRECLKAFLQYALPSPEGYGTIELGIWIRWAGTLSTTRKPRRGK